MRLRSSASPSSTAIAPDGLNGSESRRQLGMLLVDTERLTSEQVDTVLATQAKSGELFGRTAIALGMVDVGGVEEALRRQFDFPLLEPDDDRVDRAVIAAFDVDAPGLDALRALRSKIAAHGSASDPDRRVVAVLGVGPSGATANVAANLAVLSAQLGVETLLVDADLAQPRQQDLFRTANRVGLSTMLASSTARAETLLQPTAVARLSLLPAGPTVPNPVELLEGGRVVSRLGRIDPSLRWIIVDLASGEQNGTPVTIASEVDCVILVVTRGRTRLRTIEMLARRLAERGARVLGTVVVG